MSAQYLQKRIPSSPTAAVAWPPGTSGPVHLVPYRVVFGELDSLVGLHTGGAQVLHAVHAEASRLGVVLTGHAQLQGGNGYRVRPLN